MTFFMLGEQFCLKP